MAVPDEMNKIEWPDDRLKHVFAMHSAWRCGDLTTLAASLDDRIEFISPYTEGIVLRGKAEVMRHFIERKAISPRRELLEVLIGAGSFTMLQRDDVGFVAMRVVPNSELTAVLRLEASFSVGELGIAPHDPCF